MWTLGIRSNSGPPACTASTLTCWTISTAFLYCFLPHLQYAYFCCIESREGEGKHRVFVFQPQMRVSPPALGCNSFFLFPYSCDLVNCRWEANWNHQTLAWLRIFLLSGRMSSLMTGSWVPWSATFMFFVLRDKELSVKGCGFLVVREEKQEIDESMTHGWITPV